MNDSIWATVLGISKNLGSTIEYALYDISYANALMYSKATPMIGDVSDEKNADFDPRLDANNPDNFNDKDEIYV